MRSIFSVDLKCSKCGSDLDSEVKLNSNGYESKVNLLVKPCENCNKPIKDLQYQLREFLDVKII